MSHRFVIFLTVSIFFSWWNFAFGGGSIGFPAVGCHAGVIGSFVLFV